MEHSIASIVSAATLIAVAAFTPAQSPSQLPIDFAASLAEFETSDVCSIDSFSPDGRWAAIADRSCNRVYLSDLMAGEAHQWPSERVRREGDNAYPGCWSTDSSLYASAVYRPAQGGIPDSLVVIESPDGEISIQFSFDGGPVGFLDEDSILMASRGGGMSVIELRGDRPSLPRQLEVDAPHGFLIGRAQRVNGGFIAEGWTDLTAGALAHLWHIEIDGDTVRATQITAEPLCTPVFAYAVPNPRDGRWARTYIDEGTGEAVCALVEHPNMDFTQGVEIVRGPAVHLAGWLSGGDDLVLSVAPNSETMSERLWNLSDLMEFHVPGERQ